MLTRGGGADLIHIRTGELTWCSVGDRNFLEEFPHFLEYADTGAILDYLEQVGELTKTEADTCEIGEEFLTAADLAGMIRVPTHGS